MACGGQHGGNGVPIEPPLSNLALQRSSRCIGRQRFAVWPLLAFVLVGFGACKYVPQNTESWTTHTVVVTGTVQTLMVLSGNGPQTG